MDTEFDLIKYARMQIEDERERLEAATRIVDRLGELDLSLVKAIYIGHHVHLDVMGIDNYKTFVRQLRPLGGKPQRVVQSDDGEVFHKWEVPGLTTWNVLLSIDIVLDKETCKKVKVGERMTPIYKIECE